jgi:hypothetical protein
VFNSKQREPRQPFSLFVNCTEASVTTKLLTTNVVWDRSITNFIVPRKHRVRIASSLNCIIFKPLTWTTLHYLFGSFLDYSRQVSNSQHQTQSHIVTDICANILEAIYMLLSCVWISSIIGAFMVCRVMSPQRSLSNCNADVFDSQPLIEQCPGEGSVFNTEGVRNEERAPDAGEPLLGSSLLLQTRTGTRIYCASFLSRNCHHSK